MNENQAKQIFEIQVDGFCEGIKTYPGDIYDDLVFVVIDELRPAFYEALEYGNIINLIQIAEKFCAASKYLVSAYDILDKLLTLFPKPSELTEDQQFILAQILDPVDQALPGTIERLNLQWREAA